MKNVEEAYMHYLCDNVFDLKHHNYNKLLNRLQHISFRWSIYMDKNRESDGRRLRREFYDQYYIGEETLYRDERTASVLEVMIALAIRINQEYIGKHKSSIYISALFWQMIESLSLSHMDDNHYSEDIVNSNIDNFLNRTYLPNGYGGLFGMNNTIRDQRNIEIWSQAMEYVNNYI